MVTKTRHVFINITAHLFNCEICHWVMIKNMSFLVIVKSPKTLKKVEKIGLGFFKVEKAIKAHK